MSIETSTTSTPTSSHHHHHHRSNIAFLNTSNTNNSTSLNRDKQQSKQSSSISTPTTPKTPTSGETAANHHHNNVTSPTKILDEFKAVKRRIESNIRFYLLTFVDHCVILKGSEVTALVKYEGRTEELELSFEYGDLIKIVKIIAKVFDLSIIRFM